MFHLTQDLRKVNSCLLVVLLVNLVFGFNGGDMVSGTSLGDVGNRLTAGLNLLFIHSGWVSVGF